MTTFKFIITGIRTLTVGDLTDVVRHIDWTLRGEEAGQHFDLPQQTALANPGSDGFIPLSSLTEEQVILWIQENETRLSAIKEHIQYVLDKQVTQAQSTSTALPWVTAQVDPAPVVNE